MNPNFQPRGLLKWAAAWILRDEILAMQHSADRVISDLWSQIDYLTTPGEEGFIEGMDGDIVIGQPAQHADIVGDAKRKEYEEDRIKYREEREAFIQKLRDEGHYDTGEFKP